MSRVLAVSMATLCLAASPAVQGAELLPRPAALEPNVIFWMRVYSEVDTSAGLIHDSRRLDVVYEIMELPRGLSRRSRERRVGQVKKRYRSILRKLASGKRTGLSAEQRRVLGMWHGKIYPSFHNKSRQFKPISIGFFGL